MKTVEFIRVGEPTGTTSNPYWSYVSVPKGAESGVYVLASEAEAEIARLRKALYWRSSMKCKCGAELYRVSGLTHYDNRDGIREAAWCDSCRILFSSHAHGLSVIGYLHNKLEASDGKSKV